MTFDYIPSPGEHVAGAAANLIEIAKRRGTPARMSFNDIEVTARPESTADEIAAAFDAKLKEASSRYRASPEGIASAKASADERATLQAKHDALMARLPSLDFKSDVAVLDWLCEMQDPSDRSGVIVERKAIVETFANHGYVAGVNCGSLFRAEDRDNVHRWLVGQALDGLDTGPAIHHVIHKFAAEWRAKFVA